MNILAKILNMVKPGSEISDDKNEQQGRLRKFYYLVKLRQKDIFLGFCIVLISTISFNLGKINALHKTPLTITENQNQKADTYSASNIKINTAFKQNTTPLDKRVVASKASTTKKYHFTWCPGAKQIKEANKLWFETKSLAQKAGYTLAGNCQ